ncbi:MAG: hypothetical protein KAT48_13785 [Bacteroidales bacterium]|nr:hypothetical protein [Bacteroidales bacterium]
MKRKKINKKIIQDLILEQFVNFEWVLNPLGLFDNLKTKMNNVDIKTFEEIFHELVTKGYILVKISNPFSSLAKITERGYIKYKKGEWGVFIFDLKNKYRFRKEKFIIYLEKNYKVITIVLAVLVVVLMIIFN